ncbi:MAG: (2Fe-2S)-binding protein [Planctomycetota bacterium]
MSIELEVNGVRRSLDVDPSTPLLWVLRDELRLLGTKFGCGLAQCGACTVHVDGDAVRSCVTPIRALANRKVTTIEGLDGAKAEALRRAWIELEVPQCGWCQTGQIMSAAVLLTEVDRPTDEDIDAAMAGNACRCATYVRIRAAIHRAAASSAEERR